MHLLPCPQCNVAISVSPAQAGSQVVCTGCGKTVDVPRLGGLRKLPLADVADENDSGGRIETPIASRIGYSVLGLIGFVLLIAAAYGGVRWALLEVPATTEQHIAELRETYENAAVGQLIREWEEIESYDVSANVPFPYRITELRKQELGRSAATMAVAGLLSILAAIGCLLWGRRSARPV